MSDKVIIDGVDVSGCEFFFRQEHFSCSGFKQTCTGQKYCSFKQLQRLKAENEGLKAFKREGLKAFKRECLKPVYLPDSDEPEITNKYKQALEEVRDYILNNTDFDKGDCIQSQTAGFDILAIIKEVLK